MVKASDLSGVHALRVRRGQGTAIRKQLADGLVSAGCAASAALPSVSRTPRLALVQTMNQTLPALKCCALDGSKVGAGYAHRQCRQKSSIQAMTSPALLTKAVAAIKADKAKALDEFNKAVCGFKDRDLYVFCANASDGKIVAVLANPNVKSLLGTHQRTLKDSTGKAFGEELFAAALKPKLQFTEVTYLFPKPGADKTPVTKISLVTRVGDLGCRVCYYP
jgi:Single Cache domain 2